ncbi:hypothetical protein [Mucilaginibacter sp. 3215]|uniref:hypothetical protein n=1 Tax=Mucilaginibacter sp. 3215 TaxID=3373912 RepID=UPI003D1AE706
MATMYGIQVYEILDNGDLLNAIYTNSRQLYMDKYAIDTEIATKVVPDGKGIEGQYNCRFIEWANPELEFCSLTITKKGSAYKFEWSSKSAVFEGIGLMTGKNHIAVSYIQIIPTENV